MGSRRVHAVPSDDDVDGLELVLLLSAAAAVVHSVAGAVEFLAVALLVGGTWWGVEWSLVLPSALVLFVVGALLVLLFLGGAS